MTRVERIDWVDLAKKAQEGKKVIKKQFDKNDFYHILARLRDFLPYICLADNKTVLAKETLQNIAAEDKQLAGLIYVLGSVDRSKLFTLKATEFWGSCGLAPLALHVAREGGSRIKPIPYKAWSIEEKQVDFFLGKSLASSLRAFLGKYPTEEKFFGLDVKFSSLPEDIRVLLAECRMELFGPDPKTHLVSANISELIAATENKKKIQFLKRLHASTLAMKRIILQQWAAAAAYRNNAMILNPWDWDKMPIALDSIEQTDEEMEKEIFGTLFEEDTSWQEFM